MARLEPIKGTEIVEDIRLGHTFDEVNRLKRLIEENNKRVFIEIGIHEGGLSWLLIPFIINLTNKTYIGIEINCSVIRPQVRDLYAKSNAVLICKDCFDSDFFENISKLSNKIIYCDGGNKAKELQHFKNACKPGDMLLSHDYGTEVLPEDIISIEEDETFEKIENIFENTRIIGWKKT